MSGKRTSYDLGNEAFVQENYSKAIEFYSDALRETPDLGGEILLSRSEAHIKSENYEAAKKDADNIINLSRSQSIPIHPKAFLRSGVASFHMAKYSEAKNCFKEALKLENDSGLRQWIIWCDEKMEKLKIKGDVKDNNKKVDDSSEKESAKESAQAQTTNPPPPPPQLAVPSSSKIKYDYYQTESTVVIEIRIKGLKTQDVKVEFTPTTLSVSAKLPENTATAAGNEYSLELDLCHPIKDTESSFRVMATKIAITLRKADYVRWPTLEGDGSDPTEALNGLKLSGNKPVDPKQYPSSSGKNWNKIGVDIEKELANDKPEGEAALNDMFQKIYADGNDEVRKAMNKSFQESGGTVLSTNWTDIKKDKVEVKPPDGCEFKKWN